MRTGVWLMGARGSVATTSIVGALALRAGLTGPTGCVTELPELRGPALPAFTDLVLGGHDVVATPLIKRAEALAAAGVLPGRLVDALAKELADVERALRPAPTGGTQADRAAAVVRDLTDFRNRHALDRVVVVNVCRHRAGRRRAPGAPRPRRAAHRAGRPRRGAAAQLAVRVRGLHRRLPVRRLHPVHRGPAAGAGGAGRASAACRTPGTTARPGRPWSSRCSRRCSRCGTWPSAPGRGRTCSAAATARTWPTRRANAAKVASKQRVLGETLGYVPQGDTRIDYVEELGDFKTAWDLVTFAGFLGTGMRMEFTWHGCDSALAAPLVLDLARLTAAAHAAGRHGPLPELAFFFKDPLGRARPTRSPSSGPCCTTSSPACTGEATMTGLADLAELVRAPAALSVPGDVLAGAAAAGVAGPPDAGAGRRVGAALLGRHGGQRLGRPAAGRRRAAGAADPVRPGAARRPRSGSPPASPPPGSPWPPPPGAGGRRPSRCRSPPPSGGTTCWPRTPRPVPP